LKHADYRNIELLNIHIKELKELKPNVNVLEYEKESIELEGKVLVNLIEDRIQEMNTDLKYYNYRTIKLLNIDIEQLKELKSDVDVSEYEKKSIKLEEEILVNLIED
jgi:FtsZ-binding cell division protein ZapB